MKTLKAIGIAFVASALLSGCVTVDSVFGETDAPLSPVALQALQTREFSAPEDQVFKAIIATFQDYGYTISSADRSTGLVIAKTTQDLEIHEFMGYYRTEYSKATAFVDKVGDNRVKVRVSVVKHVEGKGEYGGGGAKEAVRTKPEIYQKIFDHIQNSLFLKKNL